MRNKQIARILILVVLISLIYFGITRAPAGNSNPDPADSQKIQDVIHQSYVVIRGALENGGDVREFEDVFVNTSDYHYENQDVRKFVSLVLGPEVADDGGYLTAMKAKYVAYGCASHSLRDIEQVAQKEDRKITSEEYKSIQENCYGVLPPSISEGGSPILVFKTIDIDGEKAFARYDDGAALLEATLVQENGRWLIAKIEPINIHY